MISLVIDIPYFLPTEFFVNIYFNINEKSSSIKLILSVIILIAKVCLMSDLWLIKNYTQMQKNIFYRSKHFELF